VFHIGVEHAFVFRKAWDHFQLPLPFSRVVMFVAPPIRVPTDADRDVMKAKQEEVQAALERVRDAAESWFDLNNDERDAVREQWRETQS
jgi:lysophospholipid acyltransferase (LPLAT)-like uncharacterized protein